MKAWIVWDLCQDPTEPDPEEDWISGPYPVIAIGFVDMAIEENAYFYVVPDNEHEREWSGDHWRLHGEEAFLNEDAARHQVQRLRSHRPPAPISRTG